MDAIDRFRDRIVAAGGFVHPDLRLLVGEEAEHGNVSLAGVADDELSLLVPDSVSETTKQPGPWMRFQESLGRVMDARFIRTHGVGNSIYPLFDAANHGPNGRMEMVKGGIRLYGCEWIYSTNKALLQAVWGIVDG